MAWREFERTPQRFSGIRPVSGRCGRLKCCLRYEYESYREAGARIPREGACVTLPDGGEGCVTGRDVMRETVKVRTREGRIVQVPAARVAAAAVAAPPAAEEKRGEGQDADPGDQWTESETAGEA